MRLAMKTDKDRRDAAVLLIGMLSNTVLLREQLKEFLSDVGDGDLACASEFRQIFAIMDSATDKMQKITSKITDKIFCVETAEPHREG